VQQLANDKDIATNTENLPYPYEEYMARSWIANHQDLFDRGDLLNLAITLRKQNKVIGAIGFDLDLKNNNAELGYWLGRPYWGNGYATEAARRMLHYGFTELKFHRIHSCHLKRNPASGRVLQKIGMRYEGCLREHIIKWGVYEDLEKYAILVQDYHAAARD
jgi:RimJ/RimL family protein N-acetyltransferase